MWVLESLPQLGCDPFGAGAFPWGPPGALSGVWSRGWGCVPEIRIVFWVFIPEEWTYNLTEEEKECYQECEISRAGCTQPEAVRGMLLQSGSVQGEREDEEVECALTAWTEFCENSGRVAVTPSTDVSSTHRVFAKPNHGSNRTDVWPSATRWKILPPNRQTQKFLGMSAFPGRPALQGRDVDECCSTVEGEGEIPRAENVNPASQRLSASPAPLRNVTASESQPRRMHVYVKLH